MGSRTTLRAMAKMLRRRAEGISLNPSRVSLSVASHSDRPWMLAPFRFLCATIRVSFANDSETIRDWLRDFCWGFGQDKKKPAGGLVPRGPTHCTRPGVLSSRESLFQAFSI